MMHNPASYNSLKELLAIDSPSGYTDKAIQYIKSYLENLGYKPTLLNKGSLRCALGESPTLCLAAHVDTLGLMVRGFTSEGHLLFTRIGSPTLNDVEGEDVRIHTLDGNVFTGTVLLKNPSKHSNSKVDTTERTFESMYVRLDENVRTDSDARALGIQVGDFIALDTGYQELPSGHIKSRFLDNKASCFALFEVAEYFSKRNQKVPVELYFSNFEEVGHGAAVPYSPNLEEMLVLDMGVVGDGCEGIETACSICAKDSSGPYNYEMRKRLVHLAKKHKIPYRLDVYPYYSSDGTAAQNSGVDMRVGLIGMGVAASHGSERTHKVGIEATIHLCIAYIEEYYQ